MASMHINKLRQSSKCFDFIKQEKNFSKLKQSVILNQRRSFSNCKLEIQSSNIYSCNLYNQSYSNSRKLSTSSFKLTTTKKIDKIEQTKRPNLFDPNNFTVSVVHNNVPRAGYEKIPSWKRLTKWARAIQDRDIEKVVESYSTNATLWPTLSQDFRNKPEFISPYFEGFLKRIDGKVWLIPHGCSKLADDCYYWSGTSRFELKDGEVANARFTYILKFEIDLQNGKETADIYGMSRRGDWKILHHHSSLMPQA